MFYFCTEEEGEPFEESCVEGTVYGNVCISSGKTNKEVVAGYPDKSSIMYYMLYIRVMRLIREKQQFIMLILFPLIFATLGLYTNSMQVIEPMHKFLVLNAGMTNIFNCFLF